MLLLIMCRDLEVADRRMTTAIKLVLAQAFVAGATALVRQLMGDGVLNRGSFAQRGASALRPDFGSQLLLELFVLTDVQTSDLLCRKDFLCKARWALACLLPTLLIILHEVSRVQHVGLKRNDLGGVFPLP